MASADWETLLSSMDDLTQRTGDPNAGMVFDLGDGKLHVPLPPIPAWMLDTPMYSKLPMVPAPKGKIVLFTTMLCKKLHQTPEGIDFDPAATAAALCSEYKSLHDPHLKGHYTRGVTYDRLVKDGHITPEGMVKCTLKEFNDYHQYLKAVRLEKVTQDRQKRLQAERERISRERKQSIRKEVSERDKLIKKALVRQKKVLDKARSRLARKLQTDYEKTMMRLVEQRRHTNALQQSRRKTMEEKHHGIRMNLEIETRLKKVMIRAKRNAEELRCTDLLNERRREEKALRERKLEDQWNRRELARAKRQELEARNAAKKREEIEKNVQRRDEAVAEDRMKQLRFYEGICEERHRKTTKRETNIALRLEERLDNVSRKYTSGIKRGRRRFPPINAKLTTNMTTWNMNERKQQLQEHQNKAAGALTGSSADRLPPIVSSDESTEDKKRSGPPTMAIYESSALPTLSSSAQATGDAPISIPEAIDSFTLVARQLVTTVFDELKEDPEFECVEWDDEEDKKKKEGKSKERDVDGKFESSSTESTDIEPADVSRHASLLVMNAINNALNGLYDGNVPTESAITEKLVGSRPTQVEGPSDKFLAEIVISDAVKSARARIKLDSEPSLVEKQFEGPSDRFLAEIVISDAMKSARARIKLDSEPSLVEKQESNSPAPEVVAQIVLPDIMDGALCRLRLDSEPLLEERKNSSSDQRTDSASDAVNDTLPHEDSSKSVDPTLPQVEGGGATEGEETEPGRGLNRGSILLSSVIDVFSESPDSIPSITHTVYSSSSDSDIDPDDDTVIGIVENPILGPTGDDGNIDEGLVPVMQECDGKLSVEGAILTSSSHSAGSAVEQSVTERVLSCITLERGSHTETHTTEVPSLVTHEAESSESSGDEEEEIITPSHPSSIVPIYQKHSLDIGGGLVEDNLAAVSQKPEDGGKLPGAGKCGARNSFRNIFRPDMTYCQGSAKTLRDTLVKTISRRQTTSMPAGMDVVCEVLEKEEHDIMEKHSDEALVTVEETEGLCYLPVKRKVKGQPPSSTATPTATPTAKTDAMQGEKSQPPNMDKNTSDASAPVPDKDKLPEPPAITAQESPDPKTKMEEVVQDDAVAAVTAEPSKKPAPEEKEEAEGAKADVPASKSATDAAGGGSSMATGAVNRELSAQSVDASPNLAITSSKDAGGADLASKSSSRRSSKKVTRSSSLISAVMSRLSHVFSATRRQSNASCPSHESTSEPASRQTSKKSIEERAGKGVTMETAVAVISDEQESGAPTSGTLHHGASVHFATVADDPPAKKESIYVSHRPQTPVPMATVDDEDDDEDEEEEIVGGVDEGVVDDGASTAQEIAAPVLSIEAPSCDVVQTEGDVDTEAPLIASNHGNSEATPTVAIQGENDSNNANTDRRPSNRECKPADRLPSLDTSQLHDALSINSRKSNSSRASNSSRNPAIASGSRTTRVMRPLTPSRKSSTPSSSGVKSMVINGRSLDPLGSSKVTRSLTSATSGKVAQRSTTSQRVQSGRGGRGSQQKRAGSAKKKASSTQSAIKVMSAYGGNTSNLSISGSQLLPNKLSKAYSTSRRSSRTSAAPISATNLSSRSSHGNRKSSGKGVVTPRPPSGKKPAASSSSQRAVKGKSGSTTFSNPTLATSKGGSSSQVNERGSADKLLPRRPSVEKENCLERLSTESVTRKRSSQEAVAKKKSSGTTQQQDESLPEDKPAAPMPPIKESITPHPPTQGSPSKQRQRPGSGRSKVVGDHGIDSSQ